MADRPVTTMTVLEENTRLYQGSQEAPAQASEAPENQQDWLDVIAEVTSDGKPFVVVRPAFVHMCGGNLQAAIVLSDLFYWWCPSQNGKTKLRLERNSHLWLARTREQWNEHCFLSLMEADAAIRLLKSTQELPGPDGKTVTRPALIAVGYGMFANKRQTLFRLDERAFAATYRYVTAFEGLMNPKAFAELKRARKAGDVRKTRTPELVKHERWSSQNTNAGVSESRTAGSQNTNAGVRETLRPYTETTTTTPAETSAPTTAEDYSPRHNRNYGDPQGVTPNESDSGSEFSREEVRSFFVECGRSTDEAEHFFDHYESIGWVGRFDRPIEDWRKTARRWIKREIKDNPIYPPAAPMPEPQSEPEPQMHSDAPTVAPEQPKAKRVDRLPQFAKEREAARKEHEREEALRRGGKRALAAMTLTETLAAG